MLPPDADEDDDPVIDLARALGEGLLEIAGERGRILRIDYSTGSYCSHLEMVTWSLFYYAIQEY